MWPQALLYARLNYALSSDSSADLKGLDSQVIAISNDGPFANKAFAEKNNISFPVLGDYTSNTIKDYGVLMPDLLHIKNYNAAKTFHTRVVGQYTLMQLAQILEAVTHSSFY